MSQILSNVIQILSEMCLELAEREKQNLAPAPGKLWLEVAWGGQIHHQDRMSKPQCLRGVIGETTTFGPRWLVLTLAVGGRKKVCS